MPRLPFARFVVMMVVGWLALTMTVLLVLVHVHTPLIMALGVIFLMSILLAVLMVRLSAALYGWPKLPLFVPPR